MATVYYRTFWGVNKRQELHATLDDPDEAFEGSYTALHPLPGNKFLLRPISSSPSYPSWADVNQLSRITDWSGILEKRHGGLIGYDEEQIRARITRYCDAAISFEQLRRSNIGPVLNSAGFIAALARSALLQAGGLEAGRFERIMLYPFDERWCFHTNVQTVWNRSRPEVAAQQAAGNRFLVTRKRARQPGEGFPCFATSALPGDHLLDPNAHPFPFVLHVAGNEGQGLGLGGAILANLSKAALGYCADLGLSMTPEASRLVWQHVLAVTFSPAWLSENGPAIRQDWPRVPLPNSAELLRRSATIGELVAALLDPEIPVPAVTSGTPRPELAPIAVPSTAAGATRDWRITAGWGSRSEKGVTMPGRGRVDSRPFGGGEHATEAHSMLLGETTRDVWMNGASYWRNLPEKVWDLSIGGYQVLKKWLSYREQSIIDRALTDTEVSHFQATARRLAALLLLGPELDANFRACAEAHRPLKVP